MSSLGIFDKETKTYKKVADLSKIVDMTGATSTQNGTHGFVPAPQAGDEKKVLLGDGTWGAIDDKFSFSDHDTATSGTSFTDAEDGNMLVTDWTKNLFNPTLETCEKNGITCTRNVDANGNPDGTYKLNGTAISDAYFYFIDGANKEKYKNLKNVKAFGINDDQNWEMYIIDSNGTYYGIGNNGTIINQDIDNFFVKIFKGTTLSNEIVKPMLTTDLSATYDDFVPYGGYEIKSCGKNLFHIRDYIFTGENTYSGVTFTRSDGKLILNGTSTSSFNDIIGYFDYIDGIDKYTFSGWDTNKISPIQDTIGLYSSDEFKFDFGNGAKTDATINRNRAINLVFQSGQVFDNFVLQPIVIAGHTDLYYSDFEPYTGETITVTNETESPAFGLKSHKGITHIISPGNVEVLYAKSEAGAALLGIQTSKPDTAMSDTSTNPVQNKVVNEALKGRANNITLDSVNNKLSLKSGETILNEIEGIQTGYYVGSNPPKNTSILWIDSLHGGMIKYFASDTSKWHPVRAKGYDAPVDLINEGYWHYFLGPGITVENISAIYDINTDKVTIIINNLNIASDASTGPTDMVSIAMPMYNLGHNGSFNPVIYNGPSNIDPYLYLEYPDGVIKTGPPYGIYKPATISSIKFETRLNYPAYTY